MKTIEAQGYSKEKALESTGLDVELKMLKNATQAWKKAGSPMSSKELGKFLASYITSKKAVGAYLVIDSAVDDTRMRPYNVINEITDGKRKTTTVYQIKEADLKVKTSKITNEEGEVEEVQSAEVVNLGAVVGKADKKAAAMKTMKELIEANQRDYAIEIVKEVTEGKKYAGYGVYTPSKSAKVGKFIFAVNE